MHQNVFPFHGRIILHCVHTLNFVYSLTCSWTRGLLPCFSHCECCCYERGCTHISWDSAFDLFVSYGNSLFNFLRSWLEVLFFNDWSDYPPFPPGSHCFYLELVLRSPFFSAQFDRVCSIRNCGACYESLLLLVISFIFSTLLGIFGGFSALCCTGTCFQLLAQRWISG